MKCCAYFYNCDEVVLLCVVVCWQCVWRTGTLSIPHLPAPSLSKQSTPGGSAPVISQSLNQHFSTHEAHIQIWLSWLVLKAYCQHLCRHDSQLHTLCASCFTWKPEQDLFPAWKSFHNQVFFKIHNIDCHTILMLDGNCIFLDLLMVVFPFLIDLSPMLARLFQLRFIRLHFENFWWHAPNIP